MSPTYRVGEQVLVDLPPGWDVQQTDQLLVAVTAPEPGFSANLTISTIPAERDGFAAVDLLPGVVHLGRSRYVDGFEADELLYGCAGLDGPVTVARLESPDAVVTFTAAPGDFERHWSAAQVAVRTIRTVER